MEKLLLSVLSCDTFWKRLLIWTSILACTYMLTVSSLSMAFFSVVLEEDESKISQLFQEEQREMAKGILTPQEILFPAISNWVSIVIVAPLWETFIFHWLPLVLIVRGRNSRALAVLLSVVVFAGSHYPCLPFPGIASIYARFPLAVVLACACASRIQASKWEAFLLAVILHTENNLLGTQGFTWVVLATLIVITIYLLCEICRDVRRCPRL